MQALLIAAALAAPADPLAFVVVGTGHERPTGKLIRLGRDLSATISNREGEITIPDFLSLHRAGQPLPPFPIGPHLVTTSGDRIAGSLVGGDDNSLRFKPTGVRNQHDAIWRIPLSSAAVMWLTDTPADTPLDPGKYEWLQAIKNQDVLRFRNGDIARGTLDGLEAEATTPEFRFRPEQGAARSVSAREVAAIAFNPALARTRKPKGSFARIVLADGSRISLANIALSDGILTGNLLFGQKVELPIAAVVALDVMQGKATYLSDLKPKKAAQLGFLGVAWPWMADRNAQGGPLRITTVYGQSTHDKGLGMRPRTVLTYDLAGKYQVFEATIGLEPDRGAPAPVAIRVVVDGMEREIPGLALLAAGTAIPVRIDVRGAKELVVATDFGPAGGVGSDVNWVDARVIE